MSGSVQPHRWQPIRLPCSWDSPGKNTGMGCHFLLQCMKVKVKSLSRVRLFVTPQTAAYQAPPSMGFSRQEYWSRVPSPSPKGGAVHHKEKNKEKVDMAFARTHLFCFLIVHRTILQPFKLSHFLTSPHLRHKISVTIYLTITFAIHTKPTDRGEHKRARHGA